MYPTDPVRTAQHIRLMNELKALFVETYINSDLKRAIAYRLRKWLRMKLDISLDQFSNCNYFSRSRIAVYTSIYGEIDKIHEPLVTPDNCDFYILTDQELAPNSVWEKVTFDFSQYPGTETNSAKNRFVKMHSDLLFPNHDYTIYLDGTIQPRTDLTEWIQDMPEIGIKMFAHPKRNCVYKEIHACLYAGKGNRTDLKQYDQRLKNEGFPANYGMVEGGVIVRKVGNPLCQEIMDQWWQEYSRYAKRDQLSLPYILWKTGHQMSQIAIMGQDLRVHPAIRKYPHLKSYSRQFRKV